MVFETNETTGLIEVLEQVVMAICEEEKPRRRSDEEIELKNYLRGRVDNAMLNYYWNYRKEK